MASKLGAGPDMAELANAPTQSPAGLVAQYIDEIESARLHGHGWTAIGEALARSAGMTTAIPAAAMRQAYSRYQKAARSAPTPRPSTRPSSRPAPAVAGGGRQIVNPHAPAPLAGRSVIDRDAREQGRRGNLPDGVELIGD